MNQYSYSIIFIIVLFSLALIVCLVNILGIDIGQYSYMANLDISGFN